MRQLSISLLLAFTSIGSSVMAQTLEQGNSFFIMKGMQVHSPHLKKPSNANPNNIDAVYWLGQTLIHRRDTRDTLVRKRCIRKCLQRMEMPPLLLAGMGHIELLYGNKTDSRQRFETAISSTKEKDINVLNAVAYANIDAKAGDPNYAIQKLELATQIKRFNDPETYVLMGDAYRRLLDGGNAVQSYQKALNLNPKLLKRK